MLIVKYQEKQQKAKGIWHKVNVLKFRMPDKMEHAISADPDQTAPEGAV